MTFKISGELYRILFIRTPNNAFYNTDKNLLDYQMILTRTPSTVKAALYNFIETNRK